MILRSERVGGRGLESFPVEGAEGAGDDRGDGEEPEGRQGAQHQREQQKDGQATGPGLRRTPSPGARVGADAVERGPEGGSVPEVVAECTQQRPARVTPGRLQSRQGVEGRDPAVERAARRFEVAPKGDRGPPDQHRYGGGHRDPGPGGEREQVDQVGDVGFERSVVGGPARGAEPPPSASQGERGPGGEQRDRTREHQDRQPRDTEEDATVTP